MPETFVIKQGEFEGPIEVLLRLIEEKKMHISQVSLAAVADDFIQHLEKMEQADKVEDVANIAVKNRIANFILVASTLMLIKSASLLPTLEITAEEKEGMEDLEKRLRIFQRIKDLAPRIKERFGRQIIFTREPSRNIRPVFAPTQEITPNNLIQAFRTLVATFPKPETLPKVIVKKVISLEEAITDLTKRVQTALRTSFRQALGDQREKANIIVSFLGLLELVKRGIISVEQQKHFADIQIETSESGVPKYI